MVLISFAFSWGVIDESLVDPRLIKENIETNCPADPTFGGQCQLVSSQVLEPSECREIDGVRFCRDWWKKEFVYRCDGNVNIDQLLSTFEGFEYCTYERKCVQWEDLPKRGGTVSCRIYYDKNRPGCDSNPYQPKCIANDCGELFERCTLLNYTDYSDIPDKANTEPKQYCDPVYGYCGEVQVPSASGVSVGIYTFSCPEDIRKVCRQWEVVKNCPDGTQAVCNTVSVCKKYETQTVSGYEPGSCLVDRPYTIHKVVKGSAEAQSLRNNPLCLKIGEESTPCGSSVRSYSQGSICELAGRYSAIGGNSGQVIIKRGVEVPPGTDLVLYLYVGNSCDDDNTRVDLIVKNSDTGEVIGEYHSSCNHQGNIVKIYENTPEGLRIDFKYKVAHCIGVGCGSNDYTFGDSETSTSWNYGGSTWDSHTSTFGWMFYEYEIYKCYGNSLDVAGSCNIPGNCEILSPVNNLEELECYAFEQDSENPTKMVCSKYSVMYRCPSEGQTAVCAEWETRTVCNDGTVSIPSLTLEGKDFSKDFAQAIGLAQAVNEMKHVWTGEAKVCESGWWNSIVSNPTEYFISKAVSYAISQFGAEIASAAAEYFQAASFCLNPAYAVVGADGVADCMATVAESSYTGNGGVRNAFLEKVCGGSSSFCGAARFLSDPVVMFAISVAWDIISSTDKCSTCSSEKCAAKHNDYREYVLISKGLCHYVGSKCSWKIDLGFTKVCLRRAYKHCCYDSKFARILVEQAYKQLGYSWGGYDNPNCSALTFDDLKKLDFSAMDFSELIAEIEAKMQMKVDKGYIKQVVEDFFSGDIQPTGETPWGSGN